MKSTGLHVVTGTFRRDRHARDAIAGEPGRPKPPRPLRGAARAEWRRVIDLMAEAGTLTKDAGPAVYQLAMLFAETENLKADQDATLMLAKRLKGDLVHLEAGELVRAVGELVKLRQLAGRMGNQIRAGRQSIRQYLVELGLTPTARTRVTPASPARAASKLEEFEQRQGRKVGLA